MIVGGKVSIVREGGEAVENISPVSPRSRSIPKPVGRLLGLVVWGAVDPIEIIGAPVDLFIVVANLSAIGKTGGLAFGTGEDAKNGDTSILKSPLDGFFPSLKNKPFDFLTSLSPSSIFFFPHFFFFDFRLASVS
jgi:hypothetical protein